MATPATTRITLEEFLALEEAKPYLELINGQVVEKAMPNPNHSAMVTRLIVRLGTHLERTDEGRLDTELRHVERDEERVYLPDVSVTLKGRFPWGSGGPVEVAPDLAIEVLSPSDRTGRVIERIDFFLRSGVRLVWIVDPEGETVAIYRPGKAPEVRRAPEAIDGAPVLPAFQLGLADLFAVLHPAE